MFKPVVHKIKIDLWMTWLYSHAIVVQVQIVVQIITKEEQKMRRRTV